MVKAAIESLWKGLCTVTKSQEVFSSTTKRTSFQDVVLCQNEPCRLSHSTIKASKQTDTVDEVEQVIKLFIRPNLAIPAGSRISVTQNGVTKSYKCSGESAVYTNHQEILLILEDDKA